MPQDPYKSSLYRKQYEAARTQFDTQDMDGCIAAAKHNLTDPTLPPYYVIKNSILVASALDDWNDADIFRLAAEQEWRTSYIAANRQGDADALEALKELRKELAELEEFRLQDLGITVTDETRHEAYDTAGAIDDAGYEDYSDAEMDTDDEEDTGRDMMEDTSAIRSASLAKAENQDQVAAGLPDLPIRPASEHPNRISITPAAAGPFLSHKQVRRQKSFISKGGAFHAQQFAKSLIDAQSSSNAEASGPGKDPTADKSLGDK
ncbi:hypothetical protein HBH56_178930 [Parastagonospora nodorum]|uniref:Uncharacterized protein n=2 Tax=Phaeosphaeria nodorum (strain SN15 / ATCC MYA-4574 / FGSC 10173) TaxID=321614 RepID=A0A7U2IAD7_PHANO|nr:hypothetical protein SNOG_14755 [Parastagonospora nodorum SN15]KAH3908192.1 hypothetical protein HBH56_178930 [Parastagonospora nodorum]EAT77947.1 hypothetical protein SNOG_14755 [Parastagonospora nodorum SN15]KAH3931984.1 hypothetical protein HBH54_090890 [Parastagonospora nodorum]KAH3939254.1 hypothetical protein HBH53_237480 [Parastagonospora nodorum]KAH3956807.1 hypothetical protein HBH51_234600 [Parastagonospora nodorum]